MELLTYFAVGALGGVAGALLVYFFFMKTLKAKLLSVEAAQALLGEDYHGQKSPEKRLKDFDTRIKKLEDDAGRKATEKKLEQLGQEIKALESNVVRPIQTNLDVLQATVNDRLRTIEDRLDTSRRPPNEAKSEPEPTKSIGSDQWPPSDSPEDGPTVPAASRMSEPTIHLRALLSEPKLDLPSAPLAQAVEVRSIGEIIVRSFDDLDALTMRRVEKLKQEYTNRLGPALINLYERDGAYVFLMNDQSAYIHPKPNSPLPAVWERAFLGATSYSRPIRRVHKVALVRQPDGDYDVLEKGDFEVG